MTLILSIETSTPVCSVALHQSGNLLAQSSLMLRQSHSVMLTSLLKQITEQSGYSLHDLDAIALAKGPGSYTGLRIGTATAKGLCFALEKPLLAVNTLEAMAEALRPFNDQPALLCPMLDARRMEVYCAIYDAALNVLQATEAKIIDEQSFQDLLEKQVILFFGDGAQKCESVLAHQANARFIKPFYPSATSVGRLAFARFQAQKFEDLAYFEPFYLKDFIAKTKKAL